MTTTKKKTQAQKDFSKAFKKNTVVKRKLWVTNEKNEFYRESLTSTFVTAIERSFEMVRGLEKLLPHGMWAVRMDDENDNVLYYIQDGHVYDETFNDELA